jgi:hypothetical protein
MPLLTSFLCLVSGKAATDSWQQCRAPASDLWQGSLQTRIDDVQHGYRRSLMV